MLADHIYSVFLVCESNLVSKKSHDPGIKIDPFSTVTDNEILQMVTAPNCNVSSHPATKKKGKWKQSIWQNAAKKKVPMKSSKCSKADVKVFRHIEDATKAISHEIRTGLLQTYPAIDAANKHIAVQVQKVDDLIMFVRTFDHLPSIEIKLLDMQSRLKKSMVTDYSRYRGIFYDCDVY